MLSLFTMSSLEEGALHVTSRHIDDNNADSKETVAIDVGEKTI